jgi:hypothetical protein
MLRPAVLIFQVVGMLPNVDRDQEFPALRDRAVLITGALDLEGAVFGEGEPSQPLPK